MNYVAVTGPDLNNGNGIRVTLWVAGCGHHCDGCHNAWLQDYKKGKPLSLAKDKVYEYLSKDYITGLTLSGGDPLYQSDESLDELYEFVQQVKKDFPKKDIWIYSGYKLEGLLKELNEHKLDLLTKCDYFVDGKFEKDKKNVRVPFRGSENQNIWKITDKGFEKMNDEEFMN